jgi:hypothetical protein
MMVRCIGIVQFPTLKPKQCSHSAKYGEYCKKHAPKHLLPTNGEDVRAGYAMGYEAGYAKGYECGWNEGQADYPAPCPDHSEDKLEMVWPDNICADRHEITGKWVLHYLTDEQADACKIALSSFTQTNVTTP